MSSDAAYNPVTNLTGTFTDPHPLAGYAPFGITLSAPAICGSPTRSGRPQHDPVHMGRRRLHRHLHHRRVFVTRFRDWRQPQRAVGDGPHAAELRSHGRNFWIGNFGDGISTPSIRWATDVGQPKDRTASRCMSMDCGRWSSATAPTMRQRPRCISPQARTWKARESSQVRSDVQEIFGSWRRRWHREAALIARCPE